MKSGCFDIVSVENGKFFALSEGWADYVGHTYAFMKYGNNVQETELNEWTQQNVTGNYQQLLEEVPTFFNDFIPRGLFYDLTDGLNPNENFFDNIQGFSINNHY
jgi:hypothetical protein